MRVPERRSASTHAATGLTSNRSFGGPPMSQPDSIVIRAPEPGYNRFKVARDIQNACNTSGVARELIRVIEDAARDAACGRGRLTQDPAVVAVIDKLSSLMAIDPFRAHDECAKRAG